MELEEWELLLPDEGLLEINDDGGNKIYSRKYPNDRTSVLQINYFMCPQKSFPEKFVETSRKMTTPQLLPVPFDFDFNPPSLKPQYHELSQEEAAAQIPVRAIKITRSEFSKKIASFKTFDQDQVLLNKMEKEIHFVDIKVNSMKSTSEAFQFEEDGNSTTAQKGIMTGENNNISNNNNDDHIESLNIEESHDNERGMNLWRRSLTGIGAICSFGVAAASVCIIILTNHRKVKHNEKVQFQIYTNEKRIKQMVHHAMKLDEAIRGASVTRAHTTVDGYCDAAI